MEVNTLRYIIPGSLIGKIGLHCIPVSSAKRNRMFTAVLPFGSVWKV